MSPKASTMQAHTSTALPDQPDALDAFADEEGDLLRPEVSNAVIPQPRRSASSPAKAGQRKEPGR